jgi:hypothetical protein
MTQKEINTITALLRSQDENEKRRLVSTLSNTALIELLAVLHGGK